MGRSGSVLSQVAVEEEHGEGHVRGAEAGAANGANAGKEGEQALLAGVGWAK